MNAFDVTNLLGCHPCLTLNVLQAGHRRALPSPPAAPAAVGVGVPGVGLKGVMGCLPLQQAAIHYLAFTEGFSLGFLSPGRAPPN